MTKSVKPKAIRTPAPADDDRPRIVPDPDRIIIIEADGEPVLSIQPSMDGGGKVSYTFDGHPIDPAAWPESQTPYSASALYFGKSGSPVFPLMLEVQRWAMLEAAGFPPSAVLNLLKSADWKAARAASQRRQGRPDTPKDAKASPNATIAAALGF